eukprot:CAMPEP_0118933360 /NCGR_PEP_ID=MMETSP1169-20130426/11947_1 /TAXON_ID=36882 /ORGANISM="Pyramimonas obovata, Strain CCMP722" /LENGTH=312 /DNA_ID=CAMNT_0006876113 /DNA_START=41 /DNA_END=979 /DNA_ORIENTATION=+
MALRSKVATFKALEAQVEDGHASNATIQKYLREVREQKLRRSELVSTYGDKLIDSGRLGAEELWLVHEQVIVAALDCQDIAIAKKCLSKLMKKFPDSVRVGRLRGMALEASGKWAEALTLYDALLEQAPTNGAILKRKAAVERSTGNNKGAIEALNDYLTVFMADTDAWAELADIYIETEAYSNAAFCMEEIITAAPHNYMNHLRYAEILYTAGGADNLRTARKYFATAVELTSGNCVRALYGLWACARAVDAFKGSHKQPEDESELLELSGKRLIQLYKEKCPEKAALIQKMVESSSVSTQGSSQYTVSEK